MIRGQTFDYSACGRELSRRGGGSAKSLVTACMEMARLDTPRRREFEAFAARIKGDDDSVAPLTGVRHFWRSDFTTYHRPELYASVRLTSKRLRQTETCNSENLLGRHLSDGVNYITRRGDEYTQIFPLWDWNRLPGTTVMLGDGPPTTRSACGERTFAGGVSDGRGGAAAMDFARGKLSARKAWFFFDTGYVCLGAGIDCDAESPVITSVNQCWLRGKVAIGTASSAETATAGEHRLTSGGWVQHDGVLYTFAPEQNVLVRLADQQGNWWRINRNDSKAEISRPVFSAWIDHGVQPSAATYAYEVQAAPQPTRGHAFGTVGRILSNDRNVQAVHCRGEDATGIAFYARTELNVPDFGSLAASQPCLVHLRQEDKQVRITVCNPENAAGTLALNATVPLTGEGAESTEIGTRIQIDLPTGLHAGQSVTRTFTLAPPR